MKIFEKIGRVLYESTGSHATSAAGFGFAFFTVLVLMLIGLAFGPIALVLSVVAPFAGLVLFCILSFFKELSKSVRRHFFEK